MKNNVVVRPSSIRGDITLPPSKSHTMRALLLSAMAEEGESHLTNLLFSEDTEAMIRGLRLLGAEIIVEKEHHAFRAYVKPVSRKSSPHLIPHILDVGNSGQALRFLAPLFAIQEIAVTLTGDESITSRRSMHALGKAIEDLGGSIEYHINDGFAPCTIRGPIYHKDITVQGEDSQPVSALLLSLPFLEGDGSSLIIDPMFEVPWIHFSLWWCRKVGITYHFDEAKKRFYIPGSQSIKPFQATIPADLSALLFPIIMALMTDSDVTIHGVFLDDPQGDRIVVDIVQKMGASFDYNPILGTMRIIGPQELSGIELDMDACIDALPALSLLCGYANGTSRLYNAASARKKESDRIKKSAEMLRKASIIVEEGEDELIIYGKGYGKFGSFSFDNVTHFHSGNDHRMAMSQIILALSCHKMSQQVSIESIACIGKSFPHFFEMLSQVGVEYA